MEEKKRRKRQWKEKNGKREENEGQPWKIFEKMVNFMGFFILLYRP